VHRCSLMGMGSFAGKRWSRRALLMETGSEASGGEGNLPVFGGATNGLALQIFWGEVLPRKSVL